MSASVCKKSYFPEYEKSSEEPGGLTALIKCYHIVFIVYFLYTPSLLKICKKVEFIIG